MKKSDVGERRVGATLQTKDIGAKHVETKVERTEVKVNRGGGLVSKKKGGGMHAGKTESGGGNHSLKGVKRERRSSQTKKYKRGDRNG